MSQEIRNLEPTGVWGNFADLNSIPRPSKKEERVIQFIVDFGEKLGLPTVVDEVGNVIIKKPASAGMEDRQTIVMQSHLDMVCQKNADTDFDFDSQGIDMYVDDDWVKARGTTLGADNGLGVASIMTILASTDVQHPPVEALFTIDEETGMTGALGLKGGLLSATIMLNLDTEDDDELTIGCAGGIDITAKKRYKQIATPANHEGYKIVANGFQGGHSGMEIHLGLANANKIMNRILFEATEKLGICVGEIDGGGLRNAIPRESFATISVLSSKRDEFLQLMEKLSADILTEHASTDANGSITVDLTDSPEQVMDIDFQKALLSAVYACPNGIYRMSPDIAGLVQTSNNVSRILVKDGNASVQCLTRSAIDSEKGDISNAIRAMFELIGCNVEFGGAYPGWAPKPSSDIVALMADLYREMFNGEPKVMACHAGLECGILGTNYPEMDMVSFGPNIKGAHSPDERAQISSVQKYWSFLLETLKRIPKS